jgi:hypothetical protein
MAWRTLMVALAIGAAAWRAPASIELDDATRGAVRDGLVEGAASGDPAFELLVERVRAWGPDVAAWSAAGEGPIGAALTEAEIDALIERWPASAGEAGELVGQFVEREVVPKAQGVKRWLVAPVDTRTGELTGGPAIIVYVPNFGAATRLTPDEGWYVRLAAHFYRPLELPAREGDEPRVYPGFVGMVYDVRPRWGGALSTTFGWIGLAVAVMVAVLITLLVFIARLRSREHPRLAGAGRAGAPGPGGDPTSALEAMDRGDAPGGERPDA